MGKPRADPNKLKAGRALVIILTRKSNKKGADYTTVFFFCISSSIPLLSVGNKITWLVIVQNYIATCSNKLKPIIKRERSGLVAYVYANTFGENGLSLIVLG